MITIVPVLMFATPVFYRITDLPAGLQPFAYANPLGTAIETVRALLLGGNPPPMLACLGAAALSLAICHGGYAVFERYKGIVADVI
jgi:lipopolysaccharide transport system permease protein